MTDRSERLLALNARCQHATETRPKHLGDLRVRDCDECLTNLVAGAIPLDLDAIEAAFITYWKDFGNARHNLTAAIREYLRLVDGSSFSMMAALKVQLLEPRWQHAVAWAEQSGECVACGAEVCRTALHDIGCPFRPLTFGAKGPHRTCRRSPRGTWCHQPAGHDGECVYE